MGALVNSIAVIIGSGIGLLFKGGVSEGVHKTLMNGMGLCILYLGIDGALENENVMMLIISIGLGGLLGALLDLDGWIIKKVNQIEAKWVSNNSQAETSFSQGFIAASMLMCIGSMAIIGSLESGLNGNDTTLYTKSILDFVVSLLLASSLGLGVMFSAVPILIIEGGLILFARLAVPVLTPEVITNVISIGSVILIGLGLNTLEITKIKVMNLVPAMLIPIFVMLVTMFI